MSLSESRFFSKSSLFLTLEEIKGILYKVARTYLPLGGWGDQRIWFREISTPSLEGFSQKSFLILDYKFSGDLAFLTESAIDCGDIHLRKGI